jgi:hypothetical protein
VHAGAIVSRFGQSETRICGSVSRSTEQLNGNMSHGAHFVLLRPAFTHAALAVVRIVN